MTNKLLSIIIVNWNTKTYLKQCLEAIYKTSSIIDFEVIVADNASSDASVSMIKADFPKVELLINKSNLGYAKANNQAVKLAKGEFILLLNPDVIISPDVFEKMIKYALSNKSLGALTCKLLNPNGSFQSDFYRRFPDLNTVLFYFSFLGRLIDKCLFKDKFLHQYFYEDFNFDHVKKIEQPGASCLMIPAKIIKEIGLFDEIFPIYFNDVDFCKRIWKAGYEIHMLPSSVAVHFGGGAVGQLPFYKNYAYFYSGMYDYFRKHHGILQAALVRILMFLNFIFVFLLFNKFSQLAAAYFKCLRTKGFKAANKKVFDVIKGKK